MERREKPPLFHPIRRSRVRARTKYGIRAALGILVGIPISLLALHFIYRAFGAEYKPNPFSIMMLVITFGGLAIYNVATYREDNDRSV